MPESGQLGDEALGEFTLGGEGIVNARIAQAAVGLVYEDAAGDGFPANNARLAQAAVGMVYEDASGDGFPANNARIAQVCLSMVYIGVSDHPCRQPARAIFVF